MNLTCLLLYGFFDTYSKIQDSDYLCQPLLLSRCSLFVTLTGLPGWFVCSKIFPFPFPCRCHFIQTVLPRSILQKIPPFRNERNMSRLTAISFVNSTSPALSPCSMVLLPLSWLIYLPSPLLDLSIILFYTSWVCLPPLQLEGEVLE